MNLKPCPQRAEVAAAVRDGHWPMACDSSLRVHVGECRGCAEWVLIAEALRQDRAEAIQSAPLPSPGILWWRAQLVRRQQAIQQVSKAISVAGQVSVGVMVLSVIGLLFWQPSEIREWLLLSTQFFSIWGADAAGSQALGVYCALLLGGLGVLALFGSYALYLICQRE